jgi:hypothetical protein
LAGCVFLLALTDGPLRARSLTRLNYAGFRDDVIMDNSGKLHHCRARASPALASRGGQRFLVKDVIQVLLPVEGHPYRGKLLTLP